MFIILGIIVSVIIIFCGFKNYIKERQITEKYNNDLKTCYELIRYKSNFQGFESIIEEHTEETNFSSEAYKKLYQAIDERIENLKNCNDDKDLITMLEDIRKKDINNKKIEESYLEASSYSSIIKANQYIEEQKYKEAYDLLETLITNNKEKNQDIVDMATNKQNEIKDKAFNQIIKQAQEKVNAKDYSSAKTLLEKYKDLGNQTILDIYNNATNKLNKIEAEKKAKEEAEKIAREKKEAEEKAKQAEEERKRQQAELNAKKDKLTINSNGKKIWKVCMNSNTFRFQAKYRGYGNFIVKLLDSNQDLEKVICNEIGDYNVDKTVQVVKGNYYYIETYVSDGSWNGTWWGTYGD